MSALQSLWRWLLGLSPFRLGLLIFLLGFSVRLALLFATRSYTDLSHMELERTAISLEHTGVYGNPYGLPTGPTAHVAPGYTLILAAIFKVFGTGIPGEIVKRAVSSAVSALLWALLPEAATSLALSRAAGLVAGFAGALLPVRPLVEIEGDWETPYTALALMLIAVLTVRLWKSRDLPLSEAIRQGLLWGISLLFVPALLDIFAVMAALGVYFCREAGVKRYLIFVLLESLVAGLCLAPWIIRNEHALGVPIATRTNLGLELRISNNDQASPDQRVNFLHGLFEKYHPLQSKENARMVQQMGEVGYNKWATGQAKEWIVTHPRRFIELCVGRARCYWFYVDPTSRIKSIFLGIISLLGFVGFVYVFREDKITGWIVGLILLLYPLPNYLVHVGLRQEYPIHWLMMLLATCCILHWLGFNAKRDHYLLD